MLDFVVMEVLKMRWKVLEKFNNALRAKYAFERMSNLGHNSRDHPMLSGIRKQMLNKCERELLNKHYNVLTVSQRNFVDKIFKGNIQDGNVRDGPLSEFYTEFYGKYPKTCYQEFQDFMRQRYPHLGGCDIPVISYCSLLGIGKSHPFTNSHQNTRIKELEKKPKNLLKITKRFVIR